MRASPILSAQVHTLHGIRQAAVVEVVGGGCSVRRSHRKSDGATLIRLTGLLLAAWLLEKKRCLRA
jgi:hypothetical protein